MKLPGDKVLRLTSDLPLVPATCVCGYVGKSRRPEYYRCSACYYGNVAASNRAKAKKLRARADKLMREAQECDARRQKFVARHPEAGQ